jgi:hypothetical protein
MQNPLDIVLIDDLDSGTLLDFSAQHCKRNRQPASELLK